MQENRNFTKISLADLKRLRGLGASSILVYFALRIYGGKDSIAWPSQETIGKQLGMPLPTVRRAFGDLRKNGWIVGTGKEKGKSRRYKIKDISNIICPPVKDDIRYDMSNDKNRYSDISDVIKTDIISDIQRPKRKDKEDIILIDKQGQSVTSKEEEHLFTIRGPNGDINAADLLFVELWKKHAQRFCMETDDLQIDWIKVCSDYTQNQLIRGLKRLDILMSKASHPWNSTKKYKWIDYFCNWMKTEDDRPIGRSELKKYASDIDVDLSLLEDIRQRAHREKVEQERQRDIALDPVNSVQQVWKSLRTENRAWPDLVQAVESWAAKNLTEELRQQINNDSSREMEDFKLLIR